MLDAAFERFMLRKDAPAQGGLQGFFGGPHVPPAARDAFARAAFHIREESFDEAVHIVVPRLEATVRQLVRDLGQGVATLPGRDGVGGYLSLARLFDQIRATLGGLPDAAWLNYLERLLVDRCGMNLRNEHSHGLRNLGSRHDAILLFHAACFLAQVRVTAQDS